MNNKKISIIDSNILEFVKSLEKLSMSYTVYNEINVFLNTCITERLATRLYTHFEDWTTTNNDLEFKERINKKIQSSITNLHPNLLVFIEEQRSVYGALYYTYKLLNSAKIL